MEKTKTPSHQFFKMNNTRVIQNSFLIFCSVLFCFSMLEIYLRSVNYNPLGKMLDAPAFAPLLRPSTMPERVYEATPNTSGFAWETDISINSLGFRGREYSQHKPNNSYRIIVLGDSIAFGNSLALENTFPHRLEQLFASALPANQVEVLNLALSGYDTLQEIATLAEVGIALEPDMVVLSECINDIGIASGDLIYIKRLQTYGSPIYRLRAAQFIRLLFDRIYLKRAMQKNNVNENFYLKYLNYIVDIESDDSVVPIMQELAYKTQDWNDYFEMVDHYSNKDYLGRLRYSLEWLQRIQNQHGFPVLVFMVPYLHEDIDGANTLYRSIYDIAEHEARRLGYSWLDLYQPFKQAGFEKIQRSNAIDGIHPNATGHEIIAEQLFKLTLPIIEQYFSNRD